MAGVLRGNSIDRVLEKPRDPVVREAVASSTAAKLPVQSERQLSLLILSDIRFMREGLAEVLGRDDVFQTISVAANPGEAIAVRGALKNIGAMLEEGDFPWRSTR